MEDELVDGVLNTELLKSLRKKKCWTQEKLAANAGLSLRTVQRAEGKGTSSSETLLALASALDTTSDSLVTFRSAAAEADDIASVKIHRKRSQVVGYACAALGVICAYLAISYSLVNGYVEVGNAAMWYGCIASFTSVCLGVMGVIKRQESANLGSSLAK
ncbi:helix-turn-helix domain-containing protein [Alteromonas gracilis]|uniref:helix-turn-helix domain-containing protein n=1 Tax=Alteromonas gracilis TaxID=1479524 RepID=UPI003219507F